MTITVKINIDSPTGKRLEKELRRHPDTVQFIEPTGVSNAVPEGYVSLKDGLNKASKHIIINADTVTGKMLIHELQSHPKVVKMVYPFPTDNEDLAIESISAKDSAKLAFDKLGTKYNTTFNNKYTR